ncbi:MAG: M6 family metalloprotease domain-containing protein [Muribaculaceae bacterium]|nr:M6 family metalloprotease domain-containing protein [Muribaculaceae bacterium]
MRRQILASLAAMLVAMAAVAVPAKRVPITVMQSDGTSLTVVMMGDEWGHSLVTSDGKAVARTANGDLCYRTASGVSDVIAHEVGERSSNEISFLKANEESLAAESVISLGRRAAAKKEGRKKVGQTQVPTMGSPRVPILLVEYQDKKMSNKMENFIHQYRDGETSAFQYFKDQSNGKYTPQFDVYGIYTLDSNRSVYGGNDSNGDDKGLGKMVSEAISKAGDAVDWAQYDNDGDGVCDVVIVVYAGVGEAQAENIPNSVWPCQWELSDAVRYGDGNGTVTRNGVTIDKFAVFNEITGSNDNGTKMDGVGTFCHEFSHCLGLPDFYETTYKKGYYGMGNWSLMCGGCYNNDGYLPIGYNAYEKAFMGWIDLKEPVAGTDYTLPVFNQKTAETDVAYKVVSPLNDNEYYVLENRAKQGWDKYIAGEGMLVTHVTYVASRWEANTPNDKAVQLCTIIPADNKLAESNESGDPYGKTNHELTDESTPAATLNMTSSGSVASKTGGAGFMSKPITDIAINGDKTVTFSFMKDSEPVFTPELGDAEAADVTETSFKAVWTDETAAELVESYTLEVKQRGVAGEVELLLDEDMSAGTTTWTTSAKGVYSEKTSGYVRLGTTTANGSVTSPAVNLSGSNGAVSVVITAKAYGNDKDVAMKVSVADASGNELDSETVTITGDDEEYVVVLEGEVSPASANHIVIENTTLKKRVMLKHVKVYAGNGIVAVSAAPRRVVSETGDATKRTITGITEKEYTVTGLTEGAEYTYKVKAIYTNGKESAWSASKMVSLVSSGVTEVDVRKDVKAVKYYNMLGVESATPFTGVNVVVTTYTDGTTKTTKTVK